MAKNDRLVRLRVGGGVRLECVIPNDLTDIQVEKRKLALVNLKAELAALGDHEKARGILYAVATAPTVEHAAMEIKNAQRYLREMKAREAAAPKGVPLTTFGEFSMKWAKGTLADEYPAYRELLAQSPENVRSNVSRLQYINRVIGHIPLSRLTTADCRKAVALENISKKVTTTTALRHYHQVIQTVLHRAISPCELLRDEDYPLPRIGWLPPISPPPSYAILYPHDDHKLVSNTELVMWRRVLYGLDVREGLRAAALFRLTYGNIDFANGMIIIGKGKNNANARTWELSPGVCEALRQLRGGAPATDHIFPRLDANEMLKLADGIRTDLIASGVDENVRPDLFMSGDGQEPFRFQDCRQTFVAFAMAKDWSEAAIMLRTQHTTSQIMHKRYGQKKETARVILGKQGDFLPLDVALGLANRPTPEVGVGDRVGDKNGSESESSMIPARPEGFEPPTKRIRNPAKRNLTQHEHANRADVARERARESAIPHPGEGGWGIENLDKNDLSDLNALALKAERWDLSEKLMRCLRAQADATPDTKVTSLDAARRKRRGS